MPEITKVGRIPVEQIDTLGYADGPSYDDTSTLPDDLLHGEGAPPLQRQGPHQWALQRLQPRKVQSGALHGSQLLDPYISVNIKNKKSCLNLGTMRPDANG